MHVFKENLREHKEILETSADLRGNYSPKPAPPKQMRVKTVPNYMKVLHKSEKPQFMDKRRPIKLMKTLQLA